MIFDQTPSSKPSEYINKNKTVNGVSTTEVGKQTQRKQPLKYVL